VNQALSRRAVEKLYGLELHLGAGIRCLCLLQGGAKSGALRAVPRRSSAGLSHVLLRGRDIGHRNLEKSYADLARRSVRGARSLPGKVTDVKA